jgi:hypothetical protein
MQFFYDGQIRRYITQVVRVFSNFVVKYGDGTLHRIPVMYGDPDRQVASIIRQNSENKVNSVPRIAVYVTSLALSRDRLSDQSFVGKVHVRERGIDLNTNSYDFSEGKNYTIERLMPTPFDLTLKVDIWSSSTEQKLQILEQILVLFNPSLELQTTDNYIDWTSLTVLELNDINWSSRQVPVGNDTPNEIATLTLKTPIYINPPVKVKHLGVITKIITSLNSTSVTSGTYIEGLGQDPMPETTSMGDFIDVVVTTITNYKIEVYASPTANQGTVVLLSAGGTTYPREPNLDPAPAKIGSVVDWETAFSNYPGKYMAGSSRIYLTQPNGSQVIGTIAIDPVDSSVLHVNWNPDTLVSNTGIDSQGNLDNSIHYNAAGSYRPNSTGTIDAIINPQTYNPLDPQNHGTTTTPAVGTRFLLVEDIGDTGNVDGADGWKSTGGEDLIARANDIIEWSGSAWNIIFNASQYPDTMIWQTNIYTGVQYLWNGISWNKSFDGVYEIGQWRIEL